MISFLDLPERIRSNIIIEPDGCWLWTGSIGHGKYGRAYLNQREGKAHRIIYEFLNGKVPVDLQLDHLCRVRHCVNPAHLEPVTPKVNQERGVNHNRNKMECKRGHPLSDDNLYINPRTGARSCKECRRMSTISWYWNNNYRKVRN